MKKKSYNNLGTSTEKNPTQLTNNFDFSPKKFLEALLKSKLGIWDAKSRTWDPRSRIRDPENFSGSRIQRPKNIRSWIRIRNAGLKKKKNFQGQFYFLITNCHVVILGLHEGFESPRGSLQLSRENTGLTKRYRTQA